MNSLSEKFHRYGPDLCGLGIPLRLCSGHALREIFANFGLRALAALSLYGESTVMAILLENASVVTLNAAKPVLEAQQLLIHEGTIARLGRKIHTDGLPITKLRINCSEMIVMPGLINAHCHLTEILQKSFCAITRGWKSGAVTEL